MALPSLSNKIVGSKCCKRCLIEKDPSDFYKYRYVCKSCTIARVAKHQKNNRDQKNKHARAYYQRNAAKVIAGHLKYRKENREKHLASSRRTAFRRRLKIMGATEADLIAAIEAQKGLCPICLIRPVFLNGGQYVHVDHCHKTGKFRGVLCHTCNTGLGKFADDHARLLRASEYILKAAQN